MGECKIYLVRHGQSIGNLNRVYLGHTDYDLSELGRKQAEITAEHLKNKHFDAIYSSDLLRAHNTAVPHARIHGLEIVNSVNLREIFLGEWENRPIDELIEKHYEDFVVGWKQNFGTFTVPGGENVLGAGQRFYAEIEKIAKANIGKTVLIASHAAVIRVFWCLINRVEPCDMAAAFPFPTNASYSTLTYKDGEFVPGNFSCDEHFNESKPEKSQDQ